MYTRIITEDHMGSNNSKVQVDCIYFKNNVRASMLFTYILL